MGKLIQFFSLLALATLSISCEQEVRNIAETPSSGPDSTYTSTVAPININEQGFEFLGKMQGQWVGTNRVIGQDFDWFAFDYRAISSSHIHGIFEGGTMGNLLTSFFVTDFKDTRTIMARNGGLLNGIYRTSYFVLDSIRKDANGEFYRFVDADGSTNTMWMELRFISDSLYFYAYTSRLGLNFPPSRHMTFKAKKEITSLAEAAANVHDFPKNEVAWDFSSGFNPNHLNAEPGAKSATYLAYDSTGTQDVFTLAQASGDPFVIDQHPYLAYLQVDIQRSPTIEGKTLWINLSKDPLTDNSGYFVSQDAFNSVLLFSELIGTQDEFLITYLHPGDYYINITADVNEDGILGAGDYTHPLQSITITPEGQQQITIDNITIQN